MSGGVGAVGMGAAAGMSAGTASGSSVGMGTAAGTTAGAVSYTHLTLPTIYSV